MTPLFPSDPPPGDHRRDRLAAELLPAVERQAPVWPLTAWPLHLGVVAGLIATLVVELRGVVLVFALMGWVATVVAIRLWVRAKQVRAEARHFARVLDAMLEICEANERACIRRRKVVGLPLKRRVCYELVEVATRQADAPMAMTVGHALSEGIDVCLYHEAERIRRARTLNEIDHEALLSRLAEVTRPRACATASAEVAVSPRAGQASSHEV